MNKRETLSGIGANTSRPLFTKMLALLCLLALISPFVHAKPLQTPGTESPQSQHSPTLQWIVETRNYWANVVGDTAKRLDGFFANEEQIITTNHSYLKLSIDLEQYKNGRSYIDPEAKFRLHLPTLEKKLKLVFESESPEEQTVAERTRAIGERRNSERLKDTAVGGLDIELKNKPHLNTNTGVGLRLGKPLNPFWRYRANASMGINDAWRVLGNSKLYYFHVGGWGTQHTATLQRNGPWFVFRQALDGKYDYKERRWELAHTYSFLREIDSIRAINYQVGMLAETQPDVQATAYFVHAIYRRKLHKDWLFYEMIPEFYYPKEQNWKFSPSFTIKLEMVLSGD